MCCAHAPNSIILEELMHINDNCGVWEPEPKYEFGAFHNTCLCHVYVKSLDQQAVLLQRYKLHKFLTFKTGRTIHI